MKIPVELSEETLFQLKELNAKEGCSGRSDMELLSDLISNIVDLTYKTFGTEEPNPDAEPLKNAVVSCHSEAERVKSSVVSFPVYSKIK